MSASKLILGTVQFGLNYGISNKDGQTSREEAFSVLRFAMEKGVDTLDTAYSYGEALDVIGDFHEQTVFRFKINSKFKTEANTPVSEQLSKTLDRLRIDALDTFFYHRFSDLQSGENKAELNDLKSKKFIGKIGVSIYDNNEFSAAIEDKDIDVIQIPFNLLDNASQRGALIAKANDRRKSIQVRSVFLQGLLFMNESAFPAKLRPLYRYVDIIKSIARDADLNVEELALRYALSTKDIQHVLMGVNTRMQLETNLKNCEHPLSVQVVEKINQIVVRESELLNPQHW